MMFLESCVFFISVSCVILVVTEVRSFRQPSKIFKLEWMQTLNDLPVDYVLPTIPVDSSNITIRSKCGEVLPELQERSEGVAIIINLITADPVHVPQHTMSYTDVSHSLVDVQDFLLKQSCLYNTLTRWNQLTTDLGISRWVVHGGSSIVAKCYGGLNPWDDDIDITVLNCQALDELWINGEANVSRLYPNLYELIHFRKIKSQWNTRLIATADGPLLLMKGKWYKLMTVPEASRWKPGDPLGGMEIECINGKRSPREKRTQNLFKWTAYLKG